MQIDFLGESTEGDLHLVDSAGRGSGAAQGVVNIFGMQQLEDIINVPLAKLKTATQVGAMEASRATLPSAPRGRP